MVISCYENELKQVVLNIINNAKDAILNQRQKGLLKKEEKGLITLDFKKAKDKVIILVSDNGGGIAEEVIDRIFEPYFTTKNWTQGTGIGLYMSKVIIENNMGGKLRVRNVNHGAEFRIEI